MTLTAEEKAAIVRGIARTTVFYPDLGISILSKTMDSGAMLETGLNTVIACDPQKLTEKEVKEMRERAKEIIISCSLEPEVVRDKIPPDDKVSICDFSVADLYIGQSAIVRCSMRRFWGVNQKGAMPSEKVLEESMDRAADIDEICHRYGAIHPLAAERFTQSEMALIKAIMRSGQAREYRKSKRAQVAEKRQNIHYQAGRVRRGRR